MKTTYPTIKVVLDEGAKLPSRAHDTDAGADLCACEDVRIPPRGSAVVSTGVHIELPEGTCGLLVSKSGLNVRNELTSTGLIDEGFTGEILVRVYNDGPNWHTFRKGDKVSQLVVLPVCYPTYVQSDDIAGGARGSSGFGSTGR